MKKLSGFSRHRKLVLALLLLTVIASASAAVYYALDSRYVVTSAAAKVIFISAGDSGSAGLTIGTNSTFAKLTGIKSYPNATSTYEQAVNVSNTDSSAHNIRLRSISITGGFASYGTITVKLIDPTGATQGTLTYTGGGSWTTAGSPTTFVSLLNGVKWAIRVDATLNAGAAAGVTTTIELTVDVS